MQFRTVPAALPSLTHSNKAISQAMLVAAAFLQIMSGVLPVAFKSESMWYTIKMNHNTKQPILTKVYSGIQWSSAFTGSTKAHVVIQFSQHAWSFTHERSSERVQKLVTLELD
jgi:hypothetical protein